MGAIVPFRAGITPAYAGKSLKYAKEEHGIEDHPRVCGEKQAVWCSEPGPEGSPPRMRGKEDKKEPLCGSFGITPAYAGKRNFWRLRCGSMWDHPRVCGEKKIRRSRFAAPLGSPPRMRGKADELPPHVGGYGITPAYAGKSLREAGMIC